MDAIIEADGGIVLIERSNPPLGFALPGGFVDYGESLEEAVRGEAREETGLDLLDAAAVPHLLGPVGATRGFTPITTVFSARAEGQPQRG